MTHNNNNNEEKEGEEKCDNDISYETDYPYLK